MDEFLTPPEPVQATVAAQADVVRRPAQASLARIGLLGIAAAALAAVALLAVGRATAPSSLLAAGTTGDTNQPSVVTDLKGGKGGPGGPGFKPGKGGITITGISGSSISLATEDGWTRTITVDDGTTYSKAGATIALGDLKVGDRIGFRQTKESDGSFTIDSITVILPRLGGEVTAVDGTTITVKQRDGSTATIKVDGATRYAVNGNGATLADVKVGMVLSAEGDLNDDGSLMAANVHAGDKHDRGPKGLKEPKGPKDHKGPAAPSAPTSAS